MPVGDACDIGRSAARRLYDQPGGTRDLRTAIPSACGIDGGVVPKGIEKYNVPYESVVSPFQLQPDGQLLPPVLQAPFFAARLGLVVRAACFGRDWCWCWCWCTPEPRAVLNCYQSIAHYFAD